MITTDSAIKKMKPPVSGRVELRDSVIPGLYLRVSVTGKVWYLRGRPGSEKNPVAMRIGPYGVGTEAYTLREARLKAADWKEAIKAGDDPRDEGRIRKQRAQDTFEAVVDRFLIGHGRKIKPNTLIQYTSILKGRDVQPLALKPVNKITRQHIIQILDTIADSGRLTQSNRTLSALRKFFNWCAEKYILKDSEPLPTNRVKPLTKEKPRRRVLSPAELRIVWRAAENMGWPFGDHIRLLICTAQRQSEVAGIARQDVSEGIWRQIDNKADREHLIPLNDLSLSILEAIPSLTETQKYYLSTTGETPISGFSRARRRLDGMIADICEEEGLDGLFVEPWRTHDLRRTVTTLLRRMGISQAVCSKLLNHAPRGVTALHYDAYDMLEEKTEALTTWGHYVERLISNADNVVEFKKAGADGGGAPDAP